MTEEEVKDKILKVIRLTEMVPKMPLDVPDEESEYWAKFSIELLRELGDYITLLHSKLKTNKIK